MPNDAYKHSSLERALEQIAGPLQPRPRGASDAGDSRELWRVIAADGSTRFFEKKETLAKSAPGASRQVGRKQATAQAKRIAPVRRDGAPDEKVSLLDLFDGLPTEAEAMDEGLDFDMLDEFVVRKSVGAFTSVPQTAPAPSVVCATASAEAAHAAAVDGDLSRIMRAWPSLTMGIRAAMLAMIDAATAERGAR